MQELDLPRALALYPGELVDETPGRGRSGKLSSTDASDWYFFSVCQGQQIVFSVTPPSGFDVNLSLWTAATVMVTSSNNSGSTHRNHYLHSHLHWKMVCVDKIRQRNRYRKIYLYGSLQQSE